VTIERWETLRRVTVTTSPLFRIDVIERRAPNGAEGRFFVTELADWVNVVAFTPDDELVLVRQYRQGTDEVTLEIPGGIVDDGESFIEAARRELREETGYEADELTQIGVVHPNPALQTNRTGTILARGARKLHVTNFDEHEDLEVELAPLDAVEDMVRRGEITHALVVAALYHHRLSGG
jgi:8-oxo-dGTP pyrophosphatase MutT (NUDIX family)